MGRTVETGAVNERPEDIREEGQCPCCGTEVSAEDHDHECSCSDESE